MKTIRPAFPKFITRFGDIIIALIVGLIIGAVSTLGIQSTINTASENAVQEKRSQALSNPTVVFERIASEGELVCASQTYNINEKVTQDPQTLFGPLTIPFTETSFQYQYVGTIKAGVNLEEAGFKCEDNIITVELNQPYIIANDPDMNHSGLRDKNETIFAHVLPEQVEEFRAECVKRSEYEATKQGLMDMAQEGAKKSITDMFKAALGDEYEIEFVWRQ